MVTEDQVIATLKQVFDPEIPVDVWNLGLIYNINIGDSGNPDKQNINITMTLTTPACQMIQHIKNDTMKLTTEKHIKMLAEQKE